MIKRIISKQSKTITGAAILLAGASFLSRFVGIARDRIFAHMFGASNVLDAYYAAFRIPDMVYNFVILGALSAGLIPVFTEYYKKNKKDSWLMINKLLYLFFIILIPVTILLQIFLPNIVPLVVPGFSAEQQTLTIQMSRILLFSPIILGVSGIVSGVLQSLKQFAIYSLTPIFYNVGIILGALLFTPFFGPIGLAYGVILGAFFHLFIQLPTFFGSGFKLSIPKNICHKGVNEIGKLMVPRMLALGTNQFMLIAITFFASSLGTGNITVFQFASNLQFFPVGIIGISFAVAAFPTLSQKSVEKDYKGISKYVSQTARQIIFAIVPCTILLIILRAQIIRVVYGSGSFDWQATISTADTLAFFSVSLFAQSVIPLLSRAFYALKNTTIPLVSGVIATIITIITAKQFSLLFGAPGLALAFSMGSIVQLAFLWVMLKRRIGSLQESNIITLFIKISIAALAMAITIQYLKTPLAAIINMQTFVGIFTQGLLSGTAGIAVYLIISAMLRVHELSILIKSIEKRFLKTKNIKTELLSPSD